MKMYQFLEDYGARLEKFLERCGEERKDLRDIKYHYYSSRRGPHCPYFNFVVYRGNVLYEMDGRRERKCVAEFEMPDIREISTWVDKEIKWIFKHMRLEIYNGGPLMGREAWLADWKGRLRAMFGQFG